MPPKNNDFRSLIAGLDVEVPLLNGSSHIYVNLDNAASTPSFISVRKAIDNFLDYYSSVHRGTGYKSLLSTHMYERARQVVLNFVGGNEDEHTCIFVKNTTEAINTLSRRFPFSDMKDVVLTTKMEHHSNDLPWRVTGTVDYINLLPDGRVDEDDFVNKLSRYGNRVALVAVSGASNVTGYLNPIYRFAEMCHSVGAQIAVDCAQLVPHRKVDMRSLSASDHIDFLAFSAHKMYAPFGSGALVGRKDTFEAGEPDYRGGGTVEIVSLDGADWTEPPEKDEAGSPNTIGAVALAASIKQLEEIGFDAIVRHETQLTKYALSKMKQIPGLRLFGDAEYNKDVRLGVIPFDIYQISHFLVAAILGYEFGIGVRSGCFCAHPYILQLLNLNNEEIERARRQIKSGDKSNMPGLVRASFGLYNSTDEIDQLVNALVKIVEGNYQGAYFQDSASGEYVPKGWQLDYDGILEL